MFNLHFTYQTGLLSLFCAIMLVAGCVMKPAYGRHWLGKAFLLTVPVMLWGIAVMPGLLFTRHRVAADHLLFGLATLAGVVCILLLLRTGRLFYQVMGLLYLAAFLKLATMNVTSLFYHWGYSQTVRDMIVPVSMSALVLFPVVKLTMHWRKAYLKRIHDPMRCRHCEYDLQGSLAATHCPECGQAVPGITGEQSRA